MSSSTVGRHRTVGRHNPATHLSQAVARNARPAVQVTAALSVTGALAVSGAMQAQATGNPNAENPNLASADAVVLSAPTKDAQALRFGEAGFTAAPVRQFSSVKLEGRTIQTVFRGENKDADSSTSDVEWKRSSRNLARQTQNNSTSKGDDSSNDSAPSHSGGVLGIAAGLSGIMYQWGGTTPDGFDCSGFTQYVFRKVGIELPRTASEQQDFARSVSNPRPGDLVFFGSSAYHVGIYAGDGMMYDAPRSGKRTGLHKIWSSNVSYGRV